MGALRILRSLLVVSALALPLRAVQAQRYWHDEQGRDAFQADVWLPFLKGDGHTFFTGAFVPAASIRLGDGFRFEGDIPVMRAGFDFAASGGKKNSVRIGNPYLGLRIGEDEKAISGILGLRVPAAQTPRDAIGKVAVSAAQIANLDDAEAFLPNVMALRGGLEWRRLSSSRFLLSARGVTSLDVNTSGDPTRDTEIFFDYGARMGYQGAKALATIALTGRYLITAPQSPDTCPATGSCDAKSFNERTIHTISGVVELRPGQIRPRVTLRIPLDREIRDNDAGAILGLGVSIAHR